VPYYDSIIDKKERGQLCEIKMNPFTLSQVRQHALKIAYLKQQ